MSLQAFCRCFDELLKVAEVSRIAFLRLLAQICSMEEHKQVYLALYAYYQFACLQDTKGSLLAVEKGLSLQEENLPASLLLAIKAALLTTIGKHTEALHSFKEAIQVIHFINQKKQAAHPFHKKIFPAFAARVLEAFNFARGRREFLVLLDEIKGETEGKPGFEAVSQAVNSRMNEIRESMRCAGKVDHEKKLLMSSSSMGMLASVKHEHEAESNTSIYINRLYEERRKTLGQREKSGFKKSNVSNPYQLNLHDSKEKGQCYLM